MSPAYDDMVITPRHSVSGADLDLPSGRILSLLVHADNKMCGLSANMMHIWFGQMLNHEMSKKVGSRALRCCDETEDMNNLMCYPITLDPSDDHYMGADISCMSFTRSQHAVSDHCRLGPMNQLNAQSGVMDGSSWYGADKATADKFRAGYGGRLIVDDVSPLKDLLPGKNCRQISGEDNDCKADAGDSRVSESYGLTMVTTLWWRVHNYMADTLHDMHPLWNDDQIFMEARRIAVAILQHTAFNEYFPLFIGMENARKYDILPGPGFFKGYNSKVNPQIANVVSTAAFRASHAMIAGHIEYRHVNGTIVDTEEMSEILNSELDHTVDETVMGALLQCHHTEGPSMTHQLRGLMFKNDAGIGNDLAAINIQRGRDHGLPGYNKWRKWCGLEPITDWKQLYQVFYDYETVDLMKQLYLSVDDIDIWVATISEKTLPGAVVGPTGACIMGRGLRELKIGDRFWYENGGMKNSFTPAQLAAIKKIRFSSLVCELTDEIYQVQPWALALPGPGNEIESCYDILTKYPVDISAWANEPTPEVPERYCTTNCGGSSGMQNDQMWDLP